MSRAKIDSANNASLESAHNNHTADPVDPPSINDVRDFWDANPLWRGESSNKPGSREFFEEHREVVHNDCFAGALDQRIFHGIEKDARILDLGCGIGFWLVEFWNRGFTNLHGADLSPNSLEIARQRCEAFQVVADLSVRNAENTGFERNSFDHVNCQGVVHHTTSPPAAMREICEILKPNGTASVSVYYKNAIIRNWHYWKYASKLINKFGGSLKGRGREDIFGFDDVSDIVRRYDGDDNPIGFAYDRTSFAELIGPGFAIEEVFYHFFPARALPVGMPQFVHRFLDRNVPFMIYATLRKV